MVIPRTRRFVRPWRHRSPELQQKVDFFVQTKEPPLQEFFYQGKFWDAKKEIFWTGASLKDAGRLTFAAAKMGAEIIPGLLDSIRKAASEHHEYGKKKANVEKAAK